MRTFRVYEHPPHFYEIEAEDIGDEYHTLHDLYTHRMALTIALTKLVDRTSDSHDLQAFRSKKHHPASNEMFEGYFIVWIQDSANYADWKDRGKVVMSYHYDLKHWDKFNHLTEAEYAPEYDGHTPNNVIKRLMEI